MDKDERVSTIIVASQIMTGPDLKTLVESASILSDGEHKRACLRAINKLAYAYLEVTLEMSKLINELSKKDNASEKEEEE